MATIVGKIGPFDEKAEKFSEYADRFVLWVPEVFLARFPSVGHVCIVTGAKSLWSRARFL